MGSDHARRLELAVPLAREGRVPAPSSVLATHLEIALDYREALGAGKWGDAWFLAPKPGMPPFPPAYHLLLRPAFNFDDPAHAALWLNWFYMALLALSLAMAAFLGNHLRTQRDELQARVIGDALPLRDA